MDHARFRPWPVRAVAPASAIGRFSAETVRARWDEPRVPAAAMDGYAVHPTPGDRDTAFRIVPGGLRPGDRRTSLPAGCAIGVSTGAPIPRGATAIVRSEAARVVDRELRIRGSVRPGRDIQLPGESVRRGTVLLRMGERVRPYHLGSLRSQRRDRLRIFLPRASVVVIGDELRPAGRGRPAVDDAISPVLVSLLAFAKVTVRIGVPDRHAAIAAAVRRASASADLVITVGGSSVGPYDRTKSAIASIGALLFGGVRVNVLKRGAVAIVRGVPTVILPGQVGSAVAVWHEHGLHVVGQQVGRDPRRWETGRLASRLSNSHRMDSLYLVHLRAGRVTPLRWGVHRSSELLRANALAIVPKGSVLERGSRLRCLRLDGAE